jgi:hypothetical protein
MVKMKKKKEKGKEKDTCFEVCFILFAQDALVVLASS